MSIQIKDAVSGSNRLVVFEVGGVIDGVSLSIRSNVTVAGQTAPYPGITLTRTTISANGKNSVVSHMTVLFGDKTKGAKDTGQIKGDNIVFDHMTVGWAIDEVLSMHGVNNVTLYKCIIAEGLYDNRHGDPEHSKGSFINNRCNNLSLIGCLYAHNAMRGPRMDGGAILIANQVNYNWKTGYDEPSPHWFDWVVHIYRGGKVTFMGNTAIQGPDSKGEIYLDGHHGRDFPASVKDNIIIDPNGKALTVYDPDDVQL